MFESITEGLSGALRKLAGPGRLTEANIEDGLRDVRKALLEADVSFKVVKDFIDRIRAKAVGQEVIGSVAPGQQIVKIVHDELVDLMGAGDSSIKRAPKSGEPTVIMMCGLQGSGKTTTCGKLARYLQGKGHRPLLVAADVQRPAAIDQLKVLGEQLKVPVYSETPGWMRGKPVGICQRAVKEAEKNQNDFVILDTAGRLHIDAELMSELQDVRKKVEPHNVFLVTDAMTGQDAVNSAKEFNDKLPLDGLILTKLDGDARGGAALSIRAVTGKPVKFVGMGEKLDKLEEFHPDRMATRILGMGDVVTLVEKAQKVISQEEAEDQAAKMLAGAGFTLEDFLRQLQQIKKMGPIREMLAMIPGLGSAMKDLPIEDKDLRGIEAIIQSMTRAERLDPDMINPSRRVRIAKGSGKTVQDVSALVKQFKQMQKVFKGIGKMPGIRQMFGSGRKELEEKVKHIQQTRTKKKKPF
ncbi:MAG TPA: signal recognition particle protein [Planctomycetota bacterium]|nr:signal recognition particle protein [Planctomycetota bacterium]